MRWRKRYVVESRDRLSSVLRALDAAAFLQFPIDIYIEERAPGFSAAARAYFHATCDEIGAHLGYTGGEFKDIVKAAHFGEGWETRSTEDLDAEGYSRLIEVAHLLGAWAGLGQLLQGNPHPGGTRGHPAGAGRRAPGGRWVPGRRSGGG